LVLAVPVLCMPLFPITVVILPLLVLDLPQSLLLAVVKVVHIQLEKLVVMGVQVVEQAVKALLPLVAQLLPQVKVMLVVLAIKKMRAVVAVLEQREEQVRAVAEMDLLAVLA